MKRNKVKVILAVLLFAILSFCLLVPSYAMPSMRDGVVTDKDGIIEGDTPDITLPKVTLPEGNGSMTPDGDGTDNSDGADIITPDGTSGNATTTKSPVTSSPITNNTTRAPSSSMAETEDGRGIAIWGIVLAVIIAGAVIAIIYLTVSKKR